MLDHLEKYHGISANVIYNDLHGFIRVQDLHQSAYTESFKGLACQDRKQYDKAIEHYTRAIKLKPDLGVLYNNRGAAYGQRGLHYEYAIGDLSKAIELNPLFNRSL